MSKTLEYLNYFQQVVDLSLIQDFSKKEANGYVTNQSVSLQWMKLNENQYWEIKDINLVNDYINLYKQNFYTDNKFIFIKKSLNDELYSLGFKTIYEKITLERLSAIYSEVKNANNFSLIKELKEYLVKDFIFSPICIVKRNSIHNINFKRLGTTPFLFRISVDYTKINQNQIFISPQNIPSFSLSNIVINDEYDDEVNTDMFLITYDNLKEIMLTHSKEDVFGKKFDFKKWNQWINILEKMINERYLFNNDDYVIINESWLFTPDAIIDSLLQSYYAVIENVENNNLNKFELFSEYISNFENKSIKDDFSILTDQMMMEDETTFTGQIKINRDEKTGLFGLNINQRVFIHCLKNNKKKIIALNGPPGTGKTTVLQSASATLIVDSILKNDNPKIPIIFGVSATNQAKNNIIDGFKIEKIESKDDYFSKRWIMPTLLNNIDTNINYGIQIKSPKNVKKHHELYLDNYESLLLTQEYINNSKASFLNYYNNCEDKYPKTLKKINKTFIEANFKIIHNYHDSIFSAKAEIKQNIHNIYKLLLKIENIKKQTYYLFSTSDIYIRESEIDIASYLTEKSKYHNIYLEQKTKIQSLNDEIISYELYLESCHNDYEIDILEHNHEFNSIIKKCENAITLWKTYKKNINIFKRQLLKFPYFKKNDTYQKEIKEIFTKCCLEISEYVDWERMDQFEKEMKAGYCSFKIFPKDIDENHTYHEIEFHYSRKISDIKKALILEENKEQESVKQYWALDEKIRSSTDYISKVNTKLINYENMILKLFEEDPVNCKKIIESINKKEYFEMYNEFSFLIDNTIKPLLFNLSMKYYEAKFIIDANDIIKNDYVVKNGKFKATKTKEKYDLFSNICPIFVSTMHSIPNALRTYDYKNKCDKYLFDYIDYLIVDEAGQCSSEIGALSFLFAKKAIVVGDTDQIPPVYSISDFQDFNSYNANVSNNLNYEDFLLQSYNCNNSSVMKIAQNSSLYAPYQKEKLQDGLYLLEHRRCPDEIIRYCNELVYKNQLQYSKGYDFKNLTENKLYFKNQKPWAFFNVQGKCLMSEGSRVNKEEAEAILLWIDANYHNLLSKNKKYLKDIVAILTPFSSQEKAIREMIKQLSTSGKFNNIKNIKDLEDITIGTAHKLQGAEKDIILFSMVYDSTSCGKPLFIDREKSIINVAVSRAKQSFYVFGDELIFKNAVGESTKLMWKHLNK